MKVSSSHVISFVVALSIAGYPVVASSGAILSMVSTPFSVVLRTVILGMSLLILLSNARKLKTLSPLSQSLILILVLYGIRLLVETFLKSSQLGQPIFYYWVWYLGVTVVPTLAILSSSKLNSRTIKTALVICFLYSAVAVAFKGDTQVLSNGQFVATGRASLESLNPISVGNIGTFLVLAGFWSLFSKDKKTAKIKFLWLIISLLGTYTIFISASRGPVVAVGAGVVAMIVGLGGKRKFSMLGLIPLIVVPAMYYNLSLEDALSINFLSRFTGLGGDNDLSSGIRFDLYSIAINNIFRSPILGYGIEIERYQSYPHNFFLEYYMATGLFAGTIALLVLFRVSVASIVVIRHGRLEGLFGVLFISSLVSAQFSGAVYANGTLWVLAAVVINLGRKYPA